MSIRADYVKLAALFLLLVFVSSSTYGRSLFDPEEGMSKATTSSQSSDPYVTIGFHNVNDMGLSVTNKGQIGLWGQSWQNPLNASETAQSLEFPRSTGKQHLFGGALWVGAIVNGDTLVSVARDGWFVTQEMWPDEAPYGDMEYLSIDNGDIGAVSNQDFIAVYTDTVINPALVQNDPFDGRPHVPLGIEVTQKSHVWDYPYAEDIVIIEYFIENIGSNILEDCYVGIFWDGDVFSGNPQQGDFLDDVAGFRHSVEIGDPACSFEYPIDLAYIIDNDGKDYGDGCPYDANSPRDGAGVRLLASPSDSIFSSFNWWISNSNGALDFGPRKAGTVENPFYDFGGHLGTPSGDRSKYYMMSHPEIDYNQLYAAVDHTADGWLPPPSNAVDFANGFDTRYLLSFGKFTIYPGEVLPIAIAVVGGKNILTDCDAFSSLYDPNNPDDFYNTLDFSDIDMNAVYASWIYDIPGVDTDGNGDSGHYFVCCLDSALINGSWECTVADTVYYKGDGVPDFKGFLDTVYVAIDQPQLHWADGNIAVPEDLTITLTDISLQFNPDNVEGAMVQVNGIAAASVSTIDEETGDKLVVTVDKASFVSGYGAVWDNETYDYHVTGSQSNGFMFDYIGKVNIQGHIAGDVNLDNVCDVLDVIYVINYKFKNGPAPLPVEMAGDVDGSGMINILDILYYIKFLYKDGPALYHP